MKKYLPQLIATLLILLIVIGGVALFTKNDNKQEILGATEEELIASTTKMIEDAQNEYVKKNGIYFQILPTATVVPSSGLSTSQNNLNAKPYYQKEKTSELLPNIPTSLPFQISVHQYAKPNKSNGYYIKYKKKVDGRVYEKIVGYGEDTNLFTKDWYVVYEKTN